MIRIQLLTGPHNGMTRAYDAPALTFGRNAENTITIDDAHLSRVHGEIRAEHGQYFLINHSNNGTTLNGKKIKKPTALNEGDIVGIGKMQLFAVGISSAPSTAPPPVDPSSETKAINSDESEAPKISGKAKLWIGIGSFWGIVLLVLLFASPGGGGGGNLEKPERLTNAEIKAEIIKPMKLPLDERKAARHLQQAQELYPRVTSQIDGVYQCYHDYQLSLAYSDRKDFDRTTQGNYLHVQDMLINKVQNQYNLAHTLLENKEWNRARAEFETLSQIYRDPDSKITENINKMISYARQSVKKPKSNFF